MNKNAARKAGRTASIGLKRGATIALVLSFLLLNGCKKPPQPSAVPPPSPPPAAYLFRYKFQPGEVVKYEVSINGEGEVTLRSISRKEASEEIRLPINFHGKLLMNTRIESVSPDGIGEISVLYKNFDCGVTTMIRDRETIMVLNDRKMEVRATGESKKELEFGDEGFPLNGIVDESFKMQVDTRGEIIQAQLPPDPGRAFPYIKISNLMEQIQPEFPPEAITVGTDWTKQLRVEPPDSGRPWNRGETWTITLHSTFRGLKEDDKRIAIIDLSGTYKQSLAPKNEAEDASGLRGSSHELNGTVEFDMEKGLVLSSYTRLKQELDIVMTMDQIAKGSQVRAHIKDSISVMAKLIGQ